MSKPIPTSRSFSSASWGCGSARSDITSDGVTTISASANSLNQLTTPAFARIARPSAKDRSQALRGS